jgi:hypothetical protein
MEVAALISAPPSHGKRSGNARVRLATDAQDYSNFINLNPS